MAMKIKKGDTVIVLAGKDKGRQGEVKRRVSDSLVLVDGINKVKKHVRPNPNRQIEGGIVEKEMPIHISNVAMYNSTTQRADKIGFKILDDGRKVRYFKSNNDVIDV